MMWWDKELDFIKEGGGGGGLGFAVNTGGGGGMDARVGAAAGMMDHHSRLRQQQAPAPAETTTGRSAMAPQVGAHRGRPQHHFDGGTCCDEGGHAAGIHAGGGASFPGDTVLPSPLMGE